MTLGQFLNEVSRFTNLCRVQADGWFVEDQNLGVMEQGIGEADALLHALGQLVDRPVDEVSQPAEFCDAFDGGLAGGAIEPTDLSAKYEVLADSALHVQRRAFREVSDDASDRHRIGENIMSADRRSTGTRRHVTRQDADGCRLSGAVGAEDADDLAFPDGEGDAVHSASVAVVFREILDVDHVGLGPHRRS